mgnify:CR=1 FL=1
MLTDLIENKRVEGRGVVGFYKANVMPGQEDDVTLFDDQD